MSAEGNPHIQGTPANEEYYGLLEQLSESGWVWASDVNEATGQVGFDASAPDELQGTDPEELAQHLSLVQEDGSVESGFRVSSAIGHTTEEGDDLLGVAYQGEYTDRFTATLTGMVALAGLKPE